MNTPPLFVLGIPYTNSGSLSKKVIFENFFSETKSLNHNDYKDNLPLKVM